MLSLGLSLLLLVGWTVIGASVLFGVGARAGLLRSWLLAPAVGLSVQTLLVCVFNQAGWGTDSFARPLAAGILAAALIVLWLRRVTFPVRAAIPFFGAALIFIVWAGWPALRLGFNWIAFVNDDFTNYCLSAERFRRSGFFDLPTFAQLAGRDNSQYYFFMHFSGLMRFGSEHALAFVASLTGMNALRIFMPLILALGGAQICATAALVLHRGRWRRHALWAAALLALSPVFIFGSLYQLIAQVGGLAVMLATVALLTSPFPSGRPRLLILRHAVPTALTASALLLVYPEITPFAVLTVLGFFGLELLASRQLAGARVVLLNFTLVGVFLILRFNLVGYVYTLAVQSGTGLSSSDLSLSLFPFYLIPSGFSVLFGFQALNQILPDPWGSVFILVGASLFVAACIWSLRSLRQLRPIGAMLAIYLAMAVFLFAHGNDFGLYKLAMFMQPALWAGIGAILIAVKRPVWAAVLIVVIVVPGLRTTWNYTSSSTGFRQSGITELAHASEYLGKLPTPPRGPDDLWLSNIDNVVAVKIVSNFYRGTDLRFVSKNFFNFGRELARSNWPLVEWYPHPAEFDQAADLAADIKWKILGLDTLWGAKFDVVQIGHQPTGYAVAAPGLSPFNKLNPTLPDTGRFFDVLPMNDVSNVLAFVHSSRGNHYYLGDRRVIAYSQQEQDIYAANGHVNTMGRFLLFRIDHPSPEIYLRIAASKTNMAAEHKLWSPAAKVQGTTDVPLQVKGGGAFNAFVGPLRPIVRNGAAYVALDFAEIPAPFPNHRTGLAALYHRWIPLDYRLVVAFVRDISALSDQQRLALPVPRSVRSFPRDIAEAQGLAFSGAYEDGWLSPEAEFDLGVAHPGDCLHFRGGVPLIKSTDQSADHMTVQINDGPPWVLPARPGTFDWEFPIPRPGKITRFRVSFSGHIVLEKWDDRPVGARLEILEVGPTRLSGGATMAWDGSGSGTFPGYGIDSDGWAAAKSEIFLPVDPHQSQLQLTLELPGWAKTGSATEITALIDGHPAANLTLHPGDNVLRIPIGTKLSAIRLELIASQTFTIPGGDGRTRSFRLKDLRGTVPFSPKP